MLWSEAAASTILELQNSLFMNNDVIYYDPESLHLIKYRNNYQSLVTLFRALSRCIWGAHCKKELSDMTINSRNVVNIKFHNKSWADFGCQMILMWFYAFDSQRIPGNYWRI